MSKPKPRMPTIDCPHCGTRPIVRSSRPITALFRELTYDCGECGHRFVASLSIMHTVRTSDRPNPDLNIPLRVAATLAPLMPANDFAANTPEIGAALDALDRVAL